MKHLPGKIALAILCGMAPLCGETLVTLESPAAPGIAEPGVTTVTLTGAGFPASTIQPANITITLAPQRTGAGPSGTTQATTVQLLLGTTERLTFTVPTTIVPREAVNYVVSIAGTTSTGAAFSSGNTASLQITPLASLFSIAPGSYGSPGESLRFTIVGNFTNFLEGATMANFGPGVSVGGAPRGDWGPLTVNTATNATAQIVIGMPWNSSTNPLMVATGTEELSYQQGFTISNFSPVYSFLGQGSKDGANPKRVPIIGTIPGGVPSLFGVTPYGGAANFGTVYSYPLAFGTADSVLYSFAGPPNDGETPDGALVLASNGVLYGTTGGGGSHAPSGTIFSLAPPATPGAAWTETVLHNFAGGSTDGANPYAALIIAGESNSLPILYGTTYNGGTRSNGVVFSLTPPSESGGQWTESILHFFTGSPSDGANPHTALTPGPNGVYYGTTYNGGTSNKGTVFQLTPPAQRGGAWTEAVLYSFAGSPNDGANPHGDMILGPGGVLYGTTLGGGPLGRGAVFSLTPPLPGRQMDRSRALPVRQRDGCISTARRAGDEHGQRRSDRALRYGLSWRGVWRRSRLLADPAVVARRRLDRDDPLQLRELRRNQSGGRSGNG